MPVRIFISTDLISFDEETNLEPEEFRVNVAGLVEDLPAGTVVFLVQHENSTEILRALHLVQERTYTHEESAQKHTEQPPIPRKIQTVAVRPQLTKREEEILWLVSEGKTAAQIAEQLSITSKTVEFHKSNMLSKFGAQNTAHLVRLAVEFQFLDIWK